MFVVFYAEICEKIIRLELQLRGFKLIPKMLKNSDFRKALIEHCKTSFDYFFNENVREEKKKMDIEEGIKFRTKLFGNIKFVGELNRRNLIQENIIITIFDMLLAVHTVDNLHMVDDDTVEGAVVLMNQIGHLLDDKVRETEGVSEEKQKKKDFPKKQKSAESFKKIF